MIKLPRHLFFSTILFTLLCCMGQLSAEEALSSVNNNSGDPIVMLRDVTTEVMQALRANSSVIKNNNRKLYEVVDNYILPHVDFDEMAKWVAGKSAWAKASEETRNEFVDAFKVLVVRTYATALLGYTDEKIDFGAQHIDTNKERIQVSSRVIRNNKEDVRVDYRLIKHEGEWKVYDIIIEGVSILQGFQAQFSDKIRQEGLNKVIGQIREHNRKGDV